MTLIEVEAECPYCRSELVCIECYPPKEPELTVQPILRAHIDTRVRNSIIRLKCQCTQDSGKWELCQYHEGMQDGLETIRWFRSNDDRPTTNN